MTFESYAYFFSGLSLVITLAVIIIHYYAKKRKKKVEEPKYRMLHDDD